MPSHIPMKYSQHTFCALDQFTFLFIKMIHLLNIHSVPIMLGIMLGANLPSYYREEIQGPKNKIMV